MASTTQKKISSFFTKPAQSDKTTPPNVSPSASKRPAPAEKTPTVVEPSSKRQRIQTDIRSPDGPSPKRVTTTSVTVHSNTPSERASRFLFSDPTKDRSQTQEVSQDDEETVRRKEQLHRRFVKKLGRPDSIAEIKRRNHFIEDPTGGADNEDATEEQDGIEEDAEIVPQLKKGAAVRKSTTKLTPMEKQVLDIKRKHKDTLLVVEVGYKFRFFGEDARIAAKELSIVCIPGKFRYDEHPSEAHLERFASASIPVHRLHVHVKRLVAAGHKVGVVRQLETAALKAAGDNKNAPFVRKLTNLYTKGTYVDDIEGLEGPTAGPEGGAPATGHLLCLTETNAKGWGTDEKVHVGFIAVQPATGDIVYDDFEDGFMRSEIETRLLHIAPCELLIVGELSKATEKLVQHLSGSRTNIFGDKARIERVEKPKTMAAHSYSHISDFYANKLGQEDGDEKKKVLDKIHKLSEHVTVCLSAMITHLKEYGLEHVFDLTKNFQPFSARSHMLLNGNTLTSLEIFRNQTDNTERGSLFWVLDQTQTRFGQRLLRKWVGRPLLDQSKLQERVDAVEELRDGDRSVSVEKLRKLLSKTKTDLEKNLIRIYYGKCTRPELLSFLQSIQRIGTEYAQVRTSAEAGFQSSYINNAIAMLPQMLNGVISILEKINAEAARTDDKYNFFREEEETDQITEHRTGIASVERQLDDHRKAAAEKLRKQRVEYVTVAGIEYLIEVDNSAVKSVPASWAKISGTKKLSRFHTPEVIKLVRERDQHKEALAAACDAAFVTLLADISKNYQAFRDCIQALAVLDSLLSLADVANRPNYCKPSFTAATGIKVEGGRHPMVEQLLVDAYVPNGISLSSHGTRALLITGPNMGGKSSYVRQVALIAIMAQIGSYVPAASAELGMFDAVFTRMGAFDNMMAGESTFMVELSQTSDILKQASPRSLVILDELGRGTSTHDGVAIAHAVLEHVVRETKCLLLFITHYQSLSNVASGILGGGLQNVHMKFTEGNEEGVDAADQDITFLYEIGEGVAHRSYGLNVARLANMPSSVIETASVKSRELERNMAGSKLRSLTGNLRRVMGGVGDIDVLVAGIEQL